MQTRVFAVVMGVIFIVVGIAGFIPALVAPPQTPIHPGMSYGLLFGPFPVNALHNLFHLAFGIWGVVAYRGFSSARTFAQVTAVVYAVLTVMGLIPGLQTVFGLIPLHGHDIWLHALIAIAAGYFGFRRPAAEPRTVVE